MGSVDPNGSGIVFDRSNFSSASLAQDTPGVPVPITIAVPGVFVPWDAGLIQSLGTPNIVQARVGVAPASSDIVAGLTRTQQYKICCSASVSSTPGGSTLNQFRAFINGAPTPIGFDLPGAGVGVLSGSGQGILDLGPGAIVDLRATSDGAGDLDVELAALSVELVQQVSLSKTGKN